MLRYTRLVVAALALALASAVGPVSTAVADVAPVKRISCPSVVEVNKVIPLPELNPSMVKLKATPTRCQYWTKAKEWPALQVGFVDGVFTPQQEEDRLRAGWHDNGNPVPFAPYPIPSLGRGAFAWADTSPAFVYWQFSPGAVALMTGLYGSDNLAPVAKLFRPMMEVYTVAGERTVNGRKWRTTCENYSATARCRTEIFATTIQRTPTGYRSVNDWIFNSLTYRWSHRALWENNPLGHTGQWTSSEGRMWRTECDTPTTGRGACRSYIWSAQISLRGGKYVQENVWRFNNQVLFTN